MNSAQALASSRLLVTERGVEQRADLRIGAVAVDEERARMVDVARGELALGFVEERDGARDLGRARLREGDAGSAW